MHEAQHLREQDVARGSSTARGYDYRWQQLRAKYLNTHPLCECDDCAAGSKRVTPADTVDHVQPLSLRPDLRLVWSNLRAMSKACHDAHTGRTQAWGKVRRPPTDSTPGGGLIP